MIHMIQELSGRTLRRARNENQEQSARLIRRPKTLVEHGDQKMTRARPPRTLPRQSFGCCLALFTWIAAAAAQNIPPTDPRQIADAITQLCMADRSVRVRTETMGRDLLVRSV